MKPLEISVKAAGTIDELQRNIRGALARNLPELQPAIVSHDGTLVICGSGPSLPEYINEIREQREIDRRPIVACNGAHDFLCSKGIPPNLFLSVDPRDTILPNVSLKNQDTIYLLASRCHPSVFDHLADCKIMVWHSWAPGEETEAFKGHMGIGGGTTSGMRAIHVGYVLGFRKFILYGMDSCLAPDRMTKRFSGEKAGRIVDVIVGGKTFYTNIAMAQQANEFQSLIKVLSDATFVSRGNGIITAILEERRKRGLRT